jgi:hypothetical protein
MSDRTRVGVWLLCLLVGGTILAETLVPLGVAVAVLGGWLSPLLERERNG